MLLGVFRNSFDSSVVLWNSLNLGFVSTKFWMSVIMATTCWPRTQLHTWLPSVVISFAAISGTTQRIITVDLCGFNRWAGSEAPLRAVTPVPNTQSRCMIQQLSSFCLRHLTHSCLRNWHLEGKHTNYEQYFSVFLQQFNIYVKL